MKKYAMGVAASLLLLIPASAKAQAAPRRVRVVNYYSAPAPVMTPAYYVAPAPVVSYYQPAPVVRTYYAPPPVTYYAAPAPVVTSYYYRPLLRPRVRVVQYVP